MSLHSNGTSSNDFDLNDNENHSTKQINTQKTEEPYTEEDYQFMREETKKMLINRFRISEEKAQERADLEIKSLKETFKKMPEFV